MFPAAFESATGSFGVRDALLPTWTHRPAGAVLQSLYAWMMAVGCIGLFRSVLTRENSRIRYLSDASYWLYLAHLPLVVVLQVAVRDWPLPAWLKCTGIAVVVTLVLLGVYEKAVRYTWLGRLLNGPRTRPGRVT
ncbi:MAG: acyltransferase family protein [Verrucomicrobiales bacterium]|nr:acyltransferase family protein [Verrucomicrobiales bacterium]